MFSFIRLHHARSNLKMMRESDDPSFSRQTEAMLCHALEVHVKKNACGPSPTKAHSDLCCHIRGMRFAYAEVRLSSRPKCYHDQQVLFRPVALFSSAANHQKRTHITTIKPTNTAQKHTNQLPHVFLFLVNVVGPASSQALRLASISLLSKTLAGRRVQEPRDRT